MPYNLHLISKQLPPTPTKKILSHLFTTLNLHKQIFPGHHAITLLKKHINSLKSTDYFACEKSDGIRALLYIMKYKGVSHHFLVDRKMCVYEVEGGEVDGEYLFDGEVCVSKASKEEECKEGLEEEVEDCKKDCIEDSKESKKDSKTIQKSTIQTINTPYFLVFDTILYNTPVTTLSLLKRLQLADTLIRTTLKSTYSFNIHIKKMYKSYGFYEAYNQRDKLNHECDGLIFTKVNANYTFGTCKTLYKWKPGYLNSVDFEMRRVWEGCYSLWCYGRRGGMGQMGYYFEYEVEGEEGVSVGVEKERQEQNVEKNVVQSNEQESVVQPNQSNTIQPYHSTPDYHLKIGEFHYNTNTYSIDIDDDHSIIKGKWELLKIRNDKNTPNSFKVVSNIFMSIREDITYEELIGNVKEIRDNWKRRNGEEKIRN